MKSAKKELEALNPLSVLERGYAIVTTGDSRIVSSPESVKDGDRLEIRVKDGMINALVKEKV